MKHNADDLRLLSQLFDEIDAVPEAGREAWLSGLSGPAAQLRPALRQMLTQAAGSTLEQFLAGPPEIALPATDSANPGTTASDFAAGTCIGPYRLLRPIGRGGMGEVWLATPADGRLKRKVALKLPVLSVRRSTLVQRFERERDILAALIHPHIARLYDAGITDDGQPYMALEYVEGTPITEAADAGGLDAAARVRLLRQVTDAVQYAHANLVIHRDLKPGNVLVTAAGEAKLLDFGIAKLIEDEAGPTADSELTRLGGRALTLRYAAPELVNGGAISTAVDVWALGVLLYELLAGCRPFEGKSTQSGSLEHAIVNLDPRPPSQAAEAAGSATTSAIGHLSRSLSADLDTITLKALKKHPGERFASVGALADDLDRWLRGEPVRAQRDSLWYRTRRFAGRHTAAVVATSVAGCAVIGAAAVSVVLGLQALEESRRAVAARDFMMDIFLQTDRDLSQGKELSAKALLRRSYQTVVQTLQAQPLLQTELLLGISDALDFIEDLGPADQAKEQAALAFQRLDRSRDAAHATLARAAMRHYTGWDMANAAGLLAQAWQMHPAPQRDDDFIVLHSVYQARAAGNAGQLADEQRWYERAAAAATRALRDNNTSNVMALRSLARLDGKYHADSTGVDRLNALLTRLTADPRARPAWIVGALDDLGSIDLAAGRYRVAQQRFDAANTYCQTASDPSGIQCIHVQYHRAQTLLLTGHTERALETVPALLDTSRVNESSAPFAMRFTRQAFQVLQANRQLDRHPALPAQVRAQGESISDDEWPSKLNYLQVQLRSPLDQGQLHEAKAQALRARALLAGRERDARTPAATLVLDGLVAQASGHPEQALQVLERAYAAQVEQAGADHPLTQLVGLHRARALWALQRGTEALALIDHALPILTQALGADAPALARIQALRAELAAGGPGADQARRKVDLFV